MAKITQAFRISALRRGIVVRTKQDASTPLHLAQAAMIEMANLGFLVKLDELTPMSVEALEAMLTDARHIIGADRAMKPIYPGFPKQVQELDTLTLLVEQIMHYWTAGAFLPDYPAVVREGLPLADMVRSARKVRVLAGAETARALITELTTAPIALSQDERELLKGSIELQHPDLELVSTVAGDARHGENLQTFVKFVAAVTKLSADDILTAVAPKCDNVDQLLRIVLVLASAPSAPEWEVNYELAVGTLADRHARAVRMAKLSRPTRRLVMKRLGELTKGFKADSLVTRQDLWRRVMRAVHPYDFALSAPQRRAADIVHSNGDYRTLNSRVEASMEAADVIAVVELLVEHKPGDLLRRTVALLRLVSNVREAQALADAVRGQGARSTLTTLISSYNGVISANDDHARVTRVAGLTNTMVERTAVKVKDAHLKLVAEAFKDAIGTALKSKAAPTAPVAVVSEQAVPLVRRDASTADRVLDRGQELELVGAGDVLRIFGHWNNNQTHGGYMDIGAVALDGTFETLGVSTWNSWMDEREWSTYSGDKLVHPGDDAAEFIDVDMAALRRVYPTAEWVAMTVQSYSGWPMANVDFIAGAMLRSAADKGDTFDARSVATAFKPTTEATQSVPLAVNLKSNKMVWLDSSNGSTASSASAASDTTVGSIVYDEFVRPRLTMGELASLWAEAHGVATVDAPVERDQVLSLLG